MTRPTSPPDIEKGYLDLLYDYHSDQTKKTGRNLTVASFVIVAIHLVGQKLSNVRFYLIDPSKADLKVLTSIAMTLVLFWLTMFVIYSLRDFHLQKERKLFLDRYIDDLRKNNDEHQEYVNKAETELQVAEAGLKSAQDANKNSHIQANLRDALERHRRHLSAVTDNFRPHALAYSIVIRQQDRTTGVRRLNVLTRGIFYFVPIGLALAALVYLGKDLTSSLAP